jgi:sugar lactone lactonase YvrE
MNASLVLGQPDYTSELKNCSACAVLSSALFDDYGISFDSSGNLWVVDGLDNRILEFKSPFSTYENASLAIGKINATTVFTSCPEFQSACQSSLVGPWDATFDSSGNLWVADTGNNRILEFGPPSTAPATSTTTSVATTQTLSSVTSVLTTTTVVSSQSPTTTTTALTATSSSSSSGGGGIPEFPYQELAITVFVVVLAIAYLSIRRR